MLQKLAVLTQPLTNSHHTLLQPRENVQYCSWFRWETDRQTQKKLEAVKINYVSRKREWRTLKPSTAVAALSRLALIIHTPSVPFTVSPLLAVALKAFDMDTSAAFLTALFQFEVSGLRIDCSCFGPLNCCLERGLPAHLEKACIKSNGNLEEVGKRTDGADLTRWWRACCTLSHHVCDSLCGHHQQWQTGGCCKVTTHNSCDVNEIVKPLKLC